MLRRVSVSESPPNFSSAARASTSATMVSTTTPAAGTAHTSERWWMATASSPVAMSTVASARGTVEIGFIAARTRSGWPLVMPPSSPPARLVERTTPSGPGYISSWAWLPRRRAVSKPSPISTPLIAWMPITAAASWLSSRLSPLVNDPSPTGRPSATTSTTPPRVSPSFLAASISAIMACSAALSNARTGLSSIAGRSSARGGGPS